MQLLGVVSGKARGMAGDGPGRAKKITQWTRYVTVVLALIQSTGFVFAFKSGNAGLIRKSGMVLPAGLDLIPNSTAWSAMPIVITWTSGTAFDHVARRAHHRPRHRQRDVDHHLRVGGLDPSPPQYAQLWANESRPAFIVMVAIGLGMIVAIVFVESGQRRIPVQFAKRVVGRRMYGGQSTYIPLKVNQSGVIPVIFAASLLQLPAIVANVTPWASVHRFINDNLLGQGTVSWFYIGMYTLMIIFFAYFYTAIAFNPAQQADIIRKQGGFIPGIRPGPPTERYLAKVLNRITLPGSLFLAAIAIAPLIASKAFGIHTFPFGGTSLLITVGVALETMKQIDSQLMMRNYEGFLR